MILNLLSKLKSSSHQDIDTITSCSQITSRDISRILDNRSSIVDILFRRELIKQDVYDILSEKNLLFHVRKSIQSLSAGEKTLLTDIIHDIGSLGQQKNMDYHRLEEKLQKHQYLLQ